MGQLRDRLRRQLGEPASLNKGRGARARAPSPTAQQSLYPTGARIPAARPHPGTGRAGPAHTPRHETLPEVVREVRQGPAGGFVHGEVRLPPSWQHGGLPLGCVSRLSGDAAVLLSGDLELADFDPCRALFFDLETTGLPGRWDDRTQRYRSDDKRRNATGSVLAFLVGTVRIARDGSVTLRQYLLRQQPDEPAVLEALQQALREVDFLVSFNGKAFDRNVLADRFARNRMHPSLVLALPHLDLLHPARRLYSKQLSRCSLGTLESELLGLQRPPGEVSGAEVPMHWDRYLATGNAGFLHPVLDHNTLDLLSLVTLGGHLADCVLQPDATLPEPQALAEAARLMLQRGDEQRGERLLRRLIQGQADGELQAAPADSLGAKQASPPEAFDPVTYGASWLLAEHLRRQARHDEALPLLLSMCQSAGPFDLRPWKAAAIALERRLSRPLDALQLVEQALARCSASAAPQEGTSPSSGDDWSDLVRRRIRLQKRLMRSQPETKLKSTHSRPAPGC